jgi:hypothetical protein
VTDILSLAGTVTQQPSTDDCHRNWWMVHVRLWPPWGQCKTTKPEDALSVEPKNAIAAMPLECTALPIIHGFCQGATKRPVIADVPRELPLKDT